MITPIPAAQARTLEQLDEGYELPEPTLTGIICGQCTTWARHAHLSTQVRHSSVAHVRYCHYKVIDMDAQCEADLEAEQRNERYFEERGAGQMDEGDYFRRQAGYGF